ncbi:type II toxin-antitoxin system ParD family antitoxin [Rhizobium wenxiniae]|uniref:ribbon-helix-helix domain-containing protein n=1 Tax=Rhizobium wenxiniae TaxID=1737357 RepID=UPI001C6F1055|nr:type II toxin-antitoxin system ParD family antitoxin [Rhizobium wenxiniae]MBW9087518.1 type II toxin-antitoxin system ParD family antitoxin [Rhizobium wenxiniae]
MSRNQAISLDDKQQQLVDRLVETGRYDGASDVVAMGLKLVEERERNAQAFTQDLEAEVEIGLSSGPAIAMESAEELISEFRKNR